jgi:hypothetical protein
MNKTLGIDIAGSYDFEPGASGLGIVGFIGIDLTLANIKIITNVTRNEIIYNFADSAAGAVSFGGNNLALNYDTSTHSASDVLQIILDVDAPMPVDVAPQGTLSNLLVRVLRLLSSPLGYAKDLQRYRNTAIVESGTVTTVTTVTTCSTVTNVSQLGGLPAERLINSSSRSAWATSHRARIT